MKIHLRFVAFVLVILFTVSIVGCGTNDNNGGDQVKKINLRFSHANDPAHPFHLGAEKFAELMKEKTDGAVNINIFPSAQLGNHRDLLESMQAGTVDFNVLATGPLANWLPEVGVLDMPYLFKDEKEAYKVLDSDVIKELVAPLEENGLKVIGFWAAGFRNATNSKRAINSPEDMKGLKIRVMEAPIYIDLMKAWGADPTPMAFGEVYTALQQKVIDGQENYVSSIASNRLYEVQEYIAMTKHTYSAAPVVMSLKTWNNLTSEQQNALMEAIAEATEYQRQVEDEKYVEFMKIFEEKGNVITEPDLDLFKKASQPVIDTYGKEFKQWVDKIEAAK
ncbi:MAG: DctP family TRAP transporter solute-binding subunit [Peptococcales bacterium]|jgi:tripartite ATP-independent transporter DctP family solute receptor